jgi:hypothetical protein
VKESLEKQDSINKSNIYLKIYFNYFKDKLQKCNERNPPLNPFLKNLEYLSRKIA